MGSLSLVEATEVLELGERTTAELAKLANEEHGSVLAAGAKMIEHAIGAGEALMAARSQVPSGAWRKWLKENFDATPETAVAYMRIAHHQSLIRDAGCTSLRQARVYLKGLVGPVSPGQKPHPEETKEEAIRLHAAGLTFQQTSELLGVSRVTVHGWCDPTEAERLRKRQAEYRERHRNKQIAMAAAERERAIKRAVRKAGAATQEAWSMAERMQDVLAQAQRETNDREARRALSEAGVHYRKMRDEIVRALGVA